MQKSMLYAGERFCSRVNVGSICRAGLTNQLGIIVNKVREVPLIAVGYSSINEISIFNKTGNFYPISTDPRACHFSFNQKFVA